jgi:hypothetical protein
LPRDDVGYALPDARAPWLAKRLNLLVALMVRQPSVGVVSVKRIEVWRTGDDERIPVRANQAIRLNRISLALKAAIRAHQLRVDGLVWTAHIAINVRCHNRE